MTTAPIPSEFDSSAILELRNSAIDQGSTLWDIIEQKYALKKNDASKVLGKILHINSAALEEILGFEPNFQTITYAESTAKKYLVCRRENDVKTICLISDPFDLKLQNSVESRLTFVPEWMLVHPDDLNAFFSLIEGRMRAMDGNIPPHGSETVDIPIGTSDLTFASIAHDSSPVIKLVNSSLFDAMKFGASDLHLEIGSTGLTVKYRIDGVLNHIAHVPGLSLAAEVVSRIKVMAQLDISEHRIPQDGRFKLSLKGREIDFRVSIMPSLFGEDVVIRILDKESLADQMKGLRLDHLGFDEDILIRVRQLAREPYGLMLVTGPTGSGKTTTLYAAISEINTGQDKIVTIEDPVEYQLPGILQIPVNEKKGLTFALGLRSILRHDPDKILVGEIRDSETAQIAIQSALTGHQVFTSVHANNVFDVLGRFVHMGVDTYSFVAALNGVLAQRLIRSVCKECATYDSRAQNSHEFKTSQPITAITTFMRGTGCSACRGTGYKGRVAIGEYLKMTDELREMIIARAPIRTIKEIAQGNGTKFLRDAAIECALKGITTIEEVNRVTFAV